MNCGSLVMNHGCGALALQVRPRGYDINHASGCQGGWEGSYEHQRRVSGLVQGPDGSSSSIGSSGSVRFGLIQSPVPGSVRSIHDA